MAERVADWLSAAACCEGPRPSATFSDLPRKHQDEILRAAVVATAAAAYFITLGILARPIPSRSLRAHAALPAATAPQPVSNQAWAIHVADAASRRPTSQPAQTMRPPEMALAVVPEPVRESDGHSAGSPRVERSRNIFSRFFRGVWRSVQPTTVRADLP